MTDAYRDPSPPCGFCGAQSEGARCPRCTIRVCPAHAPSGEGYCPVCARELRDDLEVVRFGAAVNEVPLDTGGLFEGGTGRTDAFAEAVRKIRVFFGEWRVRTVFAKRTPDEIAEWRRRAGVAVR